VKREEEGGGGGGGGQKKARARRNVSDKEVRGESCERGKAKEGTEVDDLLLLVRFVLTPRS